MSFNFSIDYYRRDADGRKRSSAVIGGAETLADVRKECAKDIRYYRNLREGITIERIQVFENCDRCKNAGRITVSKFKYKSCPACHGIMKTIHDVRDGRRYATIADIENTIIKDVPVRRVRGSQIVAVAATKTKSDIIFLTEGEQGPRLTNAEADTYLIKRENNRREQLIIEDRAARLEAQEAAQVIATEAKYKSMQPALF